MVAINWEEVTNIVKDRLGERFTNIVKGTGEDIKQFVVDISTDLIEAARQDRPDLVEELTNQLEMIGEKNRLVASKEAWDAAKDMIKDIIGTVMKVAFTAVL